MSHAWHARTDTAEFVDRDEGCARSGGRSVPPRQRRVWPRCKARSTRWRPTDCGCSVWRARRFASGAWPESQHDFAFDVSRPDRTCRSAAAERARRRRRMPIGRHPCGDDHRRLSGDGAERSRGRRVSTRRCRDGRRTAKRSMIPSWRDACRDRNGVRADHARAEAAHRQRAESQRRDRRDDRRRRERCAVAEGSAHRHRDGWARHRRRARGVVDRAARRRLRIDRHFGPARSANLRQPAQGDGFIFAVHVPIAGLALLPLLFGLPIVLWPIHIAFLEMVIDPVCSLVFEAETEEDDVMRRPPRSPDQPLFSRSLIGWSVLQGAVAFALVAAIFIIAFSRGMPETGSACADVLLACSHDRQSDLRQPFLQRAR